MEVDDVTCVNNIVGSIECQLKIPKISENNCTHRKNVWLSCTEDITGGCHFIFASRKVLNYSLLILIFLSFSFDIVIRKQDELYNTVLRGPASKQKYGYYFTLKIKCVEVNSQIFSFNI